MPVPIDFLRGMLGLLCLFFAHMLGRAAARAHKGTARVSRAYSWTLRTLVTFGAILWRHGFDAVSIVVLVLSLVSAALGVWLETRPKPPQEDLTSQIFPE